MTKCRTLCRTLKDLRKDHIECEGWMDDEHFKYIIQEAIKWHKKFKMISVTDEKRFEGAVGAYIFIQQFFNLTKEDLK